MNEDIELPHSAQLQKTLRKITERLAGELGRPTLVAPDWSPFEWRLARAVAVIHCVSPLLSGSLRWQGPAQWRDFLVGQKMHVAARHRRIEELLAQIDARSREEGIAVVALKGAALHSMGFYCAGERPMADVDLLVRPDETRRIAQVLRSLSFSESFTTWKHGVFVPKVCSIHTGLGEHADNHVKIEVHARIAEKLPLRITDVTGSIYPSAPHPGLNGYPSNTALMIHLLIHAAGSMASRSLRLSNLHDIALVSSRMSGSDWDDVVKPCQTRPWWALPPLQLTARYYPDAVPAHVLAALAHDCPWTLRLVRHRCLSNASLSYPWIEAFPGIAWSRSCAEFVHYIGGRIRPDKEMRRLRQMHRENDLAASRAEWSQLSQPRRMLMWLTSKPLRVETMYAVRMALAQAH
jgi:Uncharacterised nucleotidyltransferase